MGIDSLKNNLKHIKSLVRELYIFSNQLSMIEQVESSSQVVINTREKTLLNEAMVSLNNQILILNNSIPPLVEGIGFYKKLEDNKSAEPINKDVKLVEVKYNPLDSKDKISLTLNDKDKKEFLENLSKSNLSINQLKNKFSVEKPTVVNFGKPNSYAKMANNLFRNVSSDLVAKGYFSDLNRNLRKMNSPFVLGTYLSMIFFTVMISLIMGLLLFITLLFVNIGITFPFFTAISAEETIFSRLITYIWIVPIVPLLCFVIMYYYPKGEAKSLSSKIDQELPFITVHMSAIASSGVDPMSIFQVLLNSKEYPYTVMELTKLMNLINFNGKDLVTALRETSKSSSSNKLKELLDGFATTITAGGSLRQFLGKHSETLLFDYKLERERYTKTSETFMDIYISIVIAAPMILLMLFVIMGSTGNLTNFLGLSVNAISVLLILGIILLNIGFLIFLRIKQPSI
ncbi:MAG: type II secretion system F family protein [Candidatus Pacearchaeota archaeon]|jgi:Flp pilus assembly protein TadB